MRGKEREREREREGKKGRERSKEREDEKRMNVVKKKLFGLNPSDNDFIPTNLNCDARERRKKLF